MKKVAPWLAFVAGVVVLAVALPYFNSSQPKGAQLTRAEAKAIADAAARQYGIPVDQSWSILTWDHSAIVRELDKDPKLRRAAADDPVIGPRLGAYKAVYYRRGLQKWDPYGTVDVSPRTGDVLGVHLRARNEETGGKPTEDVLRPRADTFVHSRAFPGAPAPVFEGARPTVQRNRTDWTFRYRIPSKFPTGTIVPYLHVHYIGDHFAGWTLVEEYADGSNHNDGSNDQIGGTFVQMVALFAMLVVLLVMFLRKYHAGEVGVRAATLLFGITLLLTLILDFLICPPASEGTGFGGLDAQATAMAQLGFKLLFYDIPTAVLIFLAWAVGEGYARERWGDRLASFDALLRRDPLNATVGRSVLYGVLTAPAIAAGAFLVALIPILFGFAHPYIGEGSELILALGGPWSVLLISPIEAIVYSVVAILVVLAFASRRHALPIGIAVSILFTMTTHLADVPIDPYLPRSFFGWGSIAVAVAIFLGYDLLTTAIAIAGGSMIVYSLPLLSVSTGDLSTSLIVMLAVPALLLTAFAIAALMTKREIVYKYEDLAPHVRRIVERERVKAEIDAANRIQAALLPFEAPQLNGASVASHYRAATEIGGDYFDFLPQANGEVGIAFGDVSGHGLTSGIVMAMAKAALLVQVQFDASPRAVLDMLNEIVMKVAPKRIMMTFFFGLLDPQSHLLRFSSAGHLDPYVYRAATQRIEPLSSWGFPLGVRRRDPFREHSVEFSAGDRLILYSDGLIEALDDDGEPFGFERFERTLQKCGAESAEEIKKTLLASIRKFTHNRPPEDDQTLVVLSFDGVSPAMLGRAAVSAYAEQVN